MIWAMSGIATRLAATTPSRVMVGDLAARTEVAARATPARTKSHAPLVSMVAIRRTSVAVIIPPAAIAMRAALPNGLVAHSSRTMSEVVITRITSADRRECFSAWPSLQSLCEDSRGHNPRKSSQNGLRGSVPDPDPDRRWLQYFFNHTAQVVGQVVEVRLIL